LAITDAATDFGAATDTTAGMLTGADTIVTGIKL